MSCGVGQGNGSDPTLLWLWHRPSATAPICPLAWKPPYVLSVAKKKNQKLKFPDIWARTITTTHCELC